MNSPLFIAQFDDIDREARTAIGIHVLPSGGFKEVSFAVPELVWFKQTSMGVDKTISSIRALEGIGCKNINSSAAVSLAVDKIRCSELLSSICEQGHPKRSSGSIEELMSAGTRWTKPINASLGKDVMRIVGHGRTALVSRRTAGIPRHKILDAEGLRQLLAKTYNREEFMIQDDLGTMRVGGNNFEIRMLMRRTDNGWKASCKTARAGLLISNPNPESPGGIVACSALQAIRMTVEGDEKKTLAAFESKALEACLVFQAALEDPSDVGELGIDMTMSTNGPTVIEINSIPDLTFVDKAADCKNSILAMMESSGVDGDFSDLPKDDSDDSRGDIASVVDGKLANPKYRRMVERELAHEEIWLHGGNVSMPDDNDELKTHSFNDAMRILREEVELASGWAKTCDNDEKRLPMALDCVDNAIHRLMLLKEIYYLRSGKRHAFAMTRLADAGSHMSNIVVPTEKIIEQVDDMEDWLTEIKKKLPRRPSESNTPKGKYIGFDWDNNNQIINWDTPQPWDEFMEDSNYKIRKDLKR
jgi:hypothetical protein